MPDTTSRQPWERQYGESRQAFAAFVTYRDQGASRSQVRVAQEVGKNPGLMARWSSHWRWVSRVESWDREQDRLWREEQQQARRDAGRVQLRLANLALSKVVDRLSTIRPEDLTPGELMRWMTAATEIQRKAAGIEDEREQSDVRQAAGMVVELVEGIRERQRGRAAAAIA